MKKTIKNYKKISQIKQIWVITTPFEVVVCGSEKQVQVGEILGKITELLRFNYNTSL